MAGIQVRTGFSVQVPLKECFEKGDTVIYFPVPTDSKFKHWSQADKDAVKYKVYNFPTGDPADMSSDDYFKLGYQSTNSNTVLFASLEI